MRDNLRSLPEFVCLSRRTAAVFRQNLAPAIGSQAVFFVLADVGAALLVVANGLRLMAPGK